MKKRLACVFLILILLLCFSGCQNTSTNKNATDFEPTILYMPSKKAETIHLQDYAPSTKEYLYTYDNHGNLLKEEGPLGATTEYTYDENENLLKAETSSGVITTYTYDDKGLLIKKEKPNFAVQYLYDSNNNCIKEHQFYNGSEEASLVYTYSYDAEQRLIKEVMEHMNDVQTTLYTYNGNGTRTNATLTYVSAFGGSTNARITYTYDENGNLLTEHYITEFTEGTGSLMSQEKITEYQDYRVYNLSE